MELFISFLSYNVINVHMFHISNYNKHVGGYFLMSEQGFQMWHPNWVRLVPNGTNLGLFKISFSTFWLGLLILKSSRFVSFGTNLTQFWCQIGHSWLSVWVSDLRLSRTRSALNKTYVVQSGYVKIRFHTNLARRDKITDNWSVNLPDLLFFSDLMLIW